MINCIQNKSFCLNNICMCTVYIYYVCINSQTYSIYFENISISKNLNMVKKFIIIERLRVRVSVRQGLAVGGVNVQRSLHLQYHDEVPLSKAPNPQLFPGRRRINGCPLLRVCVHCCVCALGWNTEHEFRACVTMLGCMSLSLSKS